LKTKDSHNTLSVTNLAIGYKNHSIADSINFNTLSGELIGIIGINGIGKSTLLKTLGKIEAPISGEIKINSELLENLKTEALAKKVSLVLTEAIASKNVSVKELIALGRQPYTNWIGRLTLDDKAKVSEAIQLLQLEELVDKKCFQLSDGQLQRVMIARAIAQDTPIILLDEPTTHLDLHHKVLILKRLRSISQETNKTILFTSHEIDLVSQLCDKIIVLTENGSSFGTPNQLIEQGAFERLFPADAVFFDVKTKSFRMKK